MTDYLLNERPAKRAFLGSNNTSNFFDEDDEQYFSFSKASADYSMVVTNTSSIMPNHQIVDDNKDGTVMDSSSSASSISNNISHNHSMAATLDDVKMNTSNNNNNNNKGTGANTTDVVPNVNCKAEPSSKETTDLNVNKIGKSNSVKSPSTTSSSQPTTNNSQPPPSTNNKKRTRATPEQLAILEDTFKTNTSPNSKVREALAEKVNMSERSIQIWFQNRRAKMKAMQKRAHLMINQDTIGHHFMACIPGYAPHNLYPFRMGPIHQRIALPRSYSANDLNLNNVALGMRPNPNTTGLGITVPQVPQGFWPSGPLTAPITSLNTNEHLMNGFPFSAPLVAAQQQTQTPRFPISPSASPNSNSMNTQALRLVANGIPIKMNDQTSVSQPQPQPQQFTPPQEFITPAFNNNNNTSISVISCDTLTIGTWRRILTMSSPTDLLCYYTLPQNIFTYHITNENTQFKMEFSLSDIFSVEYRPIDDVHSQIAIEVKESPSFYMESPHGGWNMCKDFTEDRQASRHTRHVLKGRSAVMKPQLIKLMQDDLNLAKVVTIFDTPAPADPLSPDVTEDNNNVIINNNGQEENLPRRSSFPVSGSIANNLQYQKGDNKPDMNLLRQACTRRSASAPLSPSEDNKLVNQQDDSLQINTSTNFLNMFNKSEMNQSSPEFCSSPMELNSSSPSTPLDVFDNSPTLMDSSPLLNQDPFGLPSHNLSSLTMDSTSTLLSDEQVAAMVTFAPSMTGNVSGEDFANMFNTMSNNSSDTSSDVSEFLTFNDTYENIAGNDNFSSNNMMNLDTSAWVGDVAYCN